MTSEFRVPAPLQNAIDNLAFLASTNDGEKLFFKERLHINKTDWAARLRRFYYNETLEGQKKIIKDIIDLGLDSLKSYKDNVHYERLVVEFTKAKDGLSNLRNTYLKEGREIQDLDNYIYIMENQIKALNPDINHNNNNNTIINEQPIATITTPITIKGEEHAESRHYHFAETNYEVPLECDDDEEINNDYDNSNSNNNNNNNNNTIIVPNDTPQTNEQINEYRSKKNRKKGKSININQRPELEEYMNRNKQQ